jgi:glucokinase
MTEEVVVADIGGTHARFAIATIEGQKIVGLAKQVTMKNVDHASLQIAWEAYGREIGRALPASASFAVAAPVGGEVLQLTNSSWMIRPAQLSETLGLDRFTLINDFGAIGHAAALLGPEYFDHICGPDEAMSGPGLISVVGPGTGLGLAHVLQMTGGYLVTETEGGHIDFAPHDQVEDRLLEKLRLTHRRVSVERIVSGPGLQVIYKTFAEMEGRPAQQLDDKTLWELALSGKDSIASAAFDRFCMCLGSIAGDYALTQGASKVVIAGGLGSRIAHRLPSSGFRERFRAKGRFESLMERIPVKQLNHEQPGLYGAAGAFIKEHLAG